MNENLKHKLEEYGADIDSAIRRFMGNEAMYAKYLGKFLNDKNFTGLKESVAAKDYGEAYKYAHAMKGVTANIGLTPLYDITAGMSDILRKNEETVDEAAICQMTEELEEKYSQFCKIMEENK